MKDIENRYYQTSYANTLINVMGKKLFSNTKTANKKVALFGSL